MYGFRNDQMIDIRFVKDFTLVKQYVNKVKNFKNCTMSNVDYY